MFYDCKNVLLSRVLSFNSIISGTLVQFHLIILVLMLCRSRRKKNASSGENLDSAAAGTFWAPQKYLIFVFIPDGYFIDEMIFLLMSQVKDQAKGKRLYTIVTIAIRTLLGRFVSSVLSVLILTYAQSASLQEPR